MNRRSPSRYIPRSVERRARASLLYIVVFSALLTSAVTAYKGSLHLTQLQADEVTVFELPQALFLSFMRMVVSYAASLVLSFSLGLTAARFRLGERIIIPILDALQSVPIIAFFPAAISLFSIMSGHRIGIELAASFLILTSQAWNMAFSVYESTKTIPSDNLDAVKSFGVRGSLRFWKLYAPAAIPRLVYNSILSWSNGWYFLVAAEMIAVGNIHYNLPGIGSFLALAAEQDRLWLVLAGLIALSSLILGMDYLIWRPLSYWSERFRQDYSAGAEASSQTQRMYRQKNRSPMAPLKRAAKRVLKVWTLPIVWVVREVIAPLIWDLPAAVISAAAKEIYFQWLRPMARKWDQIKERARWIHLTALIVSGLAVGLACGNFLVKFLRPPWPAMAREIPMALLLSTGRITLTLVLSLIWIIPLVLFTWNKPRVRQWLTTLSQIGASLPAVALFPLIIVYSIKYLGAGMEFAAITLLILGNQWYILFNALGGAAVIPPDLAEAVHGYGLKRMVLWKRLVIPSIRPALITGLITAWGGGWNALVVSEWIKHKDHVLSVRGIGALLDQAVYESGDNRAIALVITAMVSWIFLINTLFWQPLYRRTAERYKLEA